MMPIKRKERENSNETNFKRMDHIPTDHELFLQAFEKPTQIYRYLRSRNRLSPIFLHRNLTYMKDRMSRKHKEKVKQNYRIDSLLNTVTARNNLEEQKNGAPNNYMTLLFLGFYNKSMVEEQFVEVEIVVSKIAQMKRKDSFKSKQERLGSAIVKVNPVDMIGKVPAVSVPTELFKPAGTGLLNSSCILQLNVTVLPHFNSPNEPVIKSNEPERCFQTELVIFDKHNRCTLSDGEYELTLQECTSTAAPKIYSPKKHPTWEVIPEHCLDEFNKGENPLDDFTKSPTLKFRLSWTKDKYAEMVDRPLPITIRKDDFITSAKENGAKLKRSDSMTSSESNCAINGNGNGTSTITSTFNTTTTTNTITTTNTNPIKSQMIGNKSNAKTQAAISANGINQSMVVKLHDIASRIIYQFIYNNNSSQQTETFDNFNCPWCCLHCLNLYSLLKHLKLCHARFNFTYVPTQSGFRVDVSINEQFDGSYIGSPHDLVGPAGSAFARAGPVRRTVVTRILVCRPRRPKHSLTEFLEIDENELNSQRPYVTGHNRLYHHTMTCLPVHPKGLDIDSEGESDPAWLQQKTMQMIDEFTDVNEGEKELMKMWNLHIMRNGYVGDIQIPLACEMFLDMRGQELLQKNLYKNFLLHLCNFFDYGLISPETLYKTVQKLQRILCTYNEGRDIMVNEHNKQLEYWCTVGSHKQRDNPHTSQVKNQATATTSSTNTYSFRNNTNSKRDESDDYDDDDDDDEEIDRSPKKCAGNQLDYECNEPESKQKKHSHTDLTQRGRNQTDFRTTAKETAAKLERTSTGNKRKAFHSRNGNSNNSPPRRRSASAALQVANNRAFAVKRRNSTAIAQSSAPSAIKKGKRLSLSIPKLNKIDK